MPVNYSNPECGDCGTRHADGHQGECIEELTRVLADSVQDSADKRRVIARLTRELDEARKQVERRDEEEAAVCPEDFSVAETVSSLRTRAEQAEAEVERLEALVKRTEWERSEQTKKLLKLMLEVERLRDALKRVRNSCTLNAAVCHALAALRGEEPTP